MFTLKRVLIYMLLMACWRQTSCTTNDTSLLGEVFVIPVECFCQRRMCYVLYILSLSIVLDHDHRYHYHNVTVGLAFALHQNDLSQY